MGKMLYNFDVSYDAGEIDVLCACGGLLERLTPERLTRIINGDNFANTFSATCRRCNVHCDVGITELFYEIQRQPEQSQKRWIALHKHVRGKAVYRNLTDFNDPADPFAPADQQRWAERGMTLVCSGTIDKPCSQNIATLETVLPEQIANIRHNRWRDVDNLSRHREFPQDFTAASKRKNELETLLTIPCFIKYNLKFSHDYKRDLYFELEPIEETEAMDQEGVDQNGIIKSQTDTEDLTLAGRCLSCGIRHDLKGAYRKELMIRWLKQTKEICSKS